VLPIGGLKEKVLGAHRAGIKHIILPLENEADLEDVPDEVRQQLTFHPVSTLPEVLQIAMADELASDTATVEEEVPAGVG
jgi:ATP-dependent Lon protease